MYRLTCPPLTLVVSPGMMDCLYAECMCTASPLFAPHIESNFVVPQGMMDCLYAECTPMITDCVLAELEKLGQKYRVALKIAKVSGCPPVCLPQAGAAEARPFVARSWSGPLACCAPSLPATYAHVLSASSRLTTVAGPAS